ncbi:SDR family NAD(P)-dependent oxidoreductase [Methylobacterium indicum]|uniref:SDR family NAD(P)-dependent oxidoreductase n=1 Tax=Methylobacterium indicum TaxID=1775910 RepID=UPI0009E8C20B|nr:SDR family oxidoreductase [Methylobacterium indicum]
MPSLHRTTAGEGRWRRKRLGRGHAIGGRSRRRGFRPQRIGSTMNRQAIVVTGANSGIGLRCCEELLAAGHLVFALDRDLDAVSAIAGGTGEMVPIRCDLLAEAQVAEAFATVARRVDRLDGLVCSAGVLRTGRLVEMSVAEFDLVFGVNTRGAWLCAKAATDLLTRSGDEATSGRIVMVASIAAIRPKINGGAYAASKAALAQLTKVLAVELAALGIRVNAVAPATVDTPMIRSAAKDGSGYKPSGSSPIGRIAEPGDIVSVIRFLLAPESDYVNGVLLPVDAGTSAAFVG